MLMNPIIIISSSPLYINPTPSLHPFLWPPKFSLNSFLSLNLIVSPLVNSYLCSFYICFTMTSYIQTTPFQQERLNLQMLNWVLPISIREEVVEKEPESNGAKWSSPFSLSSTKDSTSDSKASSVPPSNPIFKKSSKSGTKNSLDMCTETLGCENGTMYSTDDYKRDGLLSDRIGFLTQEEAEERRERKALVERRIKRVKTGTELPPPVLRTRTRDNFLNIVRERENGRMVMYAVRHQSTVTAKRRDGRLKLRLLSSCSDEMKEIQDEDESNTGEEVEREEGDYLGVVGKELKGNENGGDETEGKKYVFVGRCKEEEKRDDWTPLMVASAI